MSDAPIRLIAGLGNPGPKYTQTRHNVGFWFVDAIARENALSWKSKDRFKGEIAELTAPTKISLLKPLTFMNLSGESVGPLMRFLNLEPENVLVVHDELDIDAGAIRLKFGGGHGGHNGLRDISKHIGANYWRLRIGISHPGDAKQVVGYVLNRPSPAETISIERAIEAGVDEIADIIGGNFNVAMNTLHRTNY